MLSILPMRKARLKGIKEFAQDYIVWVWQSQNLSLCPSHFVPAHLILGCTTPFTTHYLCTVVISVPSYQVMNWLRIGTHYLHILCLQSIQKSLSTANWNGEGEILSPLFLILEKRNITKLLEWTCYHRPFILRRLTFHYNFALLILFLTRHSY